jgi:hypothetical protein
MPYARACANRLSKLRIGCGIRQAKGGFLLCDCHMQAIDRMDRNQMLERDRLVPLAVSYHSEKQTLTASIRSVYEEPSAPKSKSPSISLHTGALVINGIPFQ